MANSTFTITLPTETIALIEDLALSADVTPGKYAAALLKHALTRPTWNQVAAGDTNQALAAEVECVAAERDRARDLAALLEAENAQLVRLFTESIPGLKAAVRDLQKAVGGRRRGGGPDA